MPVDPFIRKATRPVLPTVAQRAPIFETKINRKAELIHPKPNRTHFYQTAPTAQQIVKSAVTATETSATATEPSASATTINRNFSTSSSGSDVLRKDLELSDSDGETFNIPVSLSYDELVPAVTQTNSSALANNSSALAKNISAFAKQTASLPIPIRTALATKASSTQSSISASTSSIGAVLDTNTNNPKPELRPLLNILTAYDIELPPIVRPIALEQPKSAEFKHSKSLKTNEQKNSVKAIGYIPYRPLIDQIATKKPIQERLGPKNIPPARGVDRKPNAKDRHQMRRRERYLKKLDETKKVYE